MLQPSQTNASTNHQPTPPLRRRPPHLPHRTSTVIIIIILLLFTTVIVIPPAVTTADDATLGPAATLLAVVAVAEAERRGTKRTKRIQLGHQPPGQALLQAVVVHDDPVVIVLIVIVIKLIPASLLGNRPQQGVLFRVTPRAARHRQRALVVVVVALLPVLLPVVRGKLKAGALHSPLPERLGPLSVQQRVRLEQVRVVGRGEAHVVQLVHHRHVLVEVDDVDVVVLFHKVRRVARLDVLEGLFRLGRARLDQVQQAHLDVVEHGGGGCGGKEMKRKFYEFDWRVSNEF